MQELPLADVKTIRSKLKMNKNLQDGRFRIVSSLLAFCLLIGVASAKASTVDFWGNNSVPTQDSGTLEKMIVANGNVTMEVDLNRLNGGGASDRKSTITFDAVQDTFFAILVLNGEFRGAVPSSMEITPRGSANLPAALKASARQLVIEQLPWGGDFELAVRDKKTGFTFFNISGQELTYDTNQHVLGIQSARLLISPEFAAQLGRTSDAGAIVGSLSGSTNMRTVETVILNDGEATKTVLPPLNRGDAGTNPGPDVVVGDLSGLAQFGASEGTRVGLAVGTDSCNFGTVDLDWFANPANDHPVIPQNLYRMSANGDRFEQIGQSSVKHAFTALTNNICSLGCNGVGGTHLGSGCSDPYGASLNSGPSLGSRAWINPFTGFYPRNDSATPNNDHTNHNDTAHPTAHRILVEIADLNTANNAGATYFAEAQYITPHEYVWCNANPGQCNMYNNVSYRQYTVTGTASPFSFGAANSTQRMHPAVDAWTGATHVPIEPERGVDGIAQVAYKVTQISPTLWHYEYALYNQNLDRGIQSFAVPIGNGVTLTNIGFHMPPQQPAYFADGTMNNAGFASTAWTATQDPGMMTWATETALANPNANAIRWGTTYNFRFDADKPPAQMYATVGFYKSGAPIRALIQGPRSGTPSPCARTISTGTNPCASAN
jgi:hypothetical protein